MKLPSLIRINTQDYDRQYQPFISKLAYTLNPFLEQVYKALNKNIDFDNLNQAYLSFTVTVDSNGIPKDKIEIINPLKNKPKGYTCIFAENTTDSINLNGSPFITVSYKNDNYKTLKVKHITGLVADKKYTLGILVIG